MDSRGLSDLSNLFGVDCVVLFMHQLVSHQPKAPIDNPAVCLVMFMVFEGVVNSIFSIFHLYLLESIFFIFLVPSHCEKMYDVKLVPITYKTVIAKTFFAKMPINAIQRQR